MKKKFAIIRVQFGRLGNLLNLSLKKSSGDFDFDKRGLEHLSKWNHSKLHHPGKGSRQNQWYEVKYEE